MVTFIPQSTFYDEVTNKLLLLHEFQKMLQTQTGII
jgi:hypothetical protein